jgi:flavin reductase (DIM6/NTAB) family NADH-FMN oxidoreductase RutF
MYKSFDLSALLNAEPSFRRDFVNCLSGYKSLNLIGTKSKSGKSNLAPFSQVFHIGASPPLVGILFRPHTVKRHTLENILDTGKFTLNHVTEEFYKEAHLSSARWEKSEFEATGLEEEYLADFPAPFVKKSPLKIACEFVESQTLKVNETVLLIGAIQQVWLKAEALREDGFIDLNLLGTVTVSGLDEYHIGKKIGKLGYAKPDKEVSEK